MKGRVLIIAGSDPSGGAGLQADIKTVTALGGYAAAAVTALTVQDTTRVYSAHAVAPEIIRDQIVCVLEDIGADAIKIGMIGDVAAASAIEAALDAAGGGIPLVLDPVLVATSGDSLAGAGVADFIRDRLMPRAALVTPNAPEAAILAGRAIAAADDLVAAGKLLLERGARAALVKGGHLDGAVVVDALVSAGRIDLFRNPRLASTATHGTGCTLASAAATGIAQGLPLARAVAGAIAYVHMAIRTAPGLGRGRGPLNHAHPCGAAARIDETK